MDNKTLTQQFEDKKRTFEHLETEALYVIRKALEPTNVKLHSITSRVKEVKSFLDKAERIQAKKPFEEINDVVGLRVTCLFLSDIDRIGDIIRQSFLVLAEDNKIEGSEVSSFGYMSVHFIAAMKKEYSGPRYDHIANMPLEIQVRTIAMDAWANVSHYLEYKSETDVPSDLRRDFYALSGLFYVADKHFEMFFQSRKESRAQIAESFAKTASREQEINLDSLTEYLVSKFPDREHANSTAVSELIRELSSAGIKNIGEIDRDITRASDAFELYEQEHPPLSQSGRRYMDIGVIRGVLEITNMEFRNVRRKKGLFEKDYRPYENLLK
jgi:putative GTP pyrophosphokinase